MTSNNNSKKLMYFEDKKLLNSSFLNSGKESKFTYGNVSSSNLFVDSSKKSSDEHTNNNAITGFESTLNQDANLRSQSNISSSKKEMLKNEIKNLKSLFNDKKADGEKNKKSKEHTKQSTTIKDSIKECHLENSREFSTINRKSQAEENEEPSRKLSKFNQRESGYTNLESNVSFGSSKKTKKKGKGGLKTEVQSRMSVFDEFSELSDQKQPTFVTNNLVKNKLKIYLEEENSIKSNLSREDILSSADSLEEEEDSIDNYFNQKSQNQKQSSRKIQGESNYSISKYGGNGNNKTDVRLKNGIDSFFIKKEDDLKSRKSKFSKNVSFKNKYVKGIYESNEEINPENHQEKKIKTILKTPSSNQKKEKKEVKAKNQLEVMSINNFEIGNNQMEMYSPSNNLTIAPQNHHDSHNIRKEENKEVAKPAQNLETKEVIIPQNYLAQKDKKQDEVIKEEDKAKQEQEISKNNSRKETLQQKKNKNVNCCVIF